jgi:hypothetical protein
MTPRRALAAVVLLFVGLSAAVLMWTPPWESNDEPDHVRNVATLAQGKWYRIEPGAGYSAHQAPLYYMAMSVWHRALQLDRAVPTPPRDDRVLLRPGPMFRHDYPGHADDERRVRLLRIPNIALGVATILLTFACARRLTDDPWTPVVAAATVASIPRFVFLSGVINNDNLVHALGAVLAFVTVHYLTAPPTSTSRRVFASGIIGVVFGALVLTKISAVPLGVGAAFAIFFLSRSRAEFFRLATAGALGTALACGWWLVRNNIWYGDPLASTASKEHLRLNAFAQRFEPPPESAVEKIFSSVPETLLNSFFYISGWSQWRWSLRAHAPYWLLTLASFAGFLPRAGRQRMEPGVRHAVLVLAALLVGAFSSLWFVGLLNTALPTTIQGRLAFSGLAALGCLVALGVERLGVPVVARFTLPFLGLAGTLIALRQDVWLRYVA